MPNEGTSFAIYARELIAWNKKFNLTSITDPAEIKVKHFADSLALLNVIPLTDQKVIDVGSGAGFPGIPLKLAAPDLKLTLVEATGKKAEFLKHLVKLLELSDVEVLALRAEDIPREKRESYDLAVARAVAKLDTLSEYCLPWVKLGGKFVAYKERQIEDEVKASRGAIETLGGTVREIRQVVLPGSDIVRSFVIIEKVSPTPEKYPRRSGIPRKRPLQ